MPERQLGAALLKRYLPLAREFLIEAAHYHQTVTYRQLTDALRGGAGRGYVGQVLDALNEETHAKGQPFLSALVVDQSTGRPGEGFYDLVRRLKGAIGDPDEVWEQERDAAWAFDWPR